MKFLVVQKNRSGLVLNDQQRATLAQDPRVLGVVEDAHLDLSTDDIAPYTAEITKALATDGFALLSWGARDPKGVSPVPLTPVDSFAEIVLILSRNGGGA